MTYPVISPTVGYVEVPTSKYAKLYNNVFFDYFSEQMPRNHKEMMKWAELVFYSTPVLVNGIRKLINYPITDFVYMSDSEKVKEDTKDLLEKKLNIKKHLFDMGMDCYIYGNVFRSVYFPFVRFLVCPVCREKVNVKNANYKMRRGTFILTCSKCRTTRTARVEDEYIDDPSRIKIISWDPHSIDLSHNPVTGDTAYYYNIPRVLANGILAGDKVFVESLHSIFLDAFRQAKTVHFSDNFYHMKFPTITGFASGWGVSPLMPVLKPFMYMAILRKGREAIGLEQITPRNILFPAGNNSSDPTITSSMNRWRTEISKALENWRRDPNYVMLAPYPTGIVNIGSQGKGLLPSQEIAAAEEEMLRALDIPIEFVYGTTTLQNSTVALRLLENQLIPYTAQVILFVNWVIDQINAKCDKKYCYVKMVPSKLADDIQQKQLMIQLIKNGVSTTTIQELFGLKPEEEREKMKLEAIEDYRVQQDIEMQQKKLQNNVAVQVHDEQAASATGVVPKYNQQQLIAAAQDIVAQLVAIPYEQRRSVLAQLQKEDYVQYCMVRTMMESVKNKGEGI